MTRQRPASSLALGSTAALNWGFFTQHGAAGSLPPLSIRRPLASLRLLSANRRWLAGFLIGLAGWALYIAALRLAPLSLVQAVSAGGFGLLALLRWSRRGPPVPRGGSWGGCRRRHGLALLAVSLAAPEQWHGTAPAAFATGLWLAGLRSRAGAVAALGGLGVPAAAALVSAAGILYATGDVATKAAVLAAGLLLVPVVLAAHGARVRRCSSWASSAAARWSRLGLRRCSRTRSRSPPGRRSSANVSRRARSATSGWRRSRSFLRGRRCSERASAPAPPTDSARASQCGMRSPEAPRVAAGVHAGSRRADPVGEELAVDPLVLVQGTGRRWTDVEGVTTSSPPRARRACSCGICSRSRPNRRQRATRGRAAACPPGRRWK